MQPSNPAPKYTKDLIIYEIATKGFTSPNGPESGTFNSLKQKMAYLEELGINAIWLTGHSLSDPRHFYNIWTQYACIAPDVIDPSLGTEEDFRTMITEAHAHGIRVILDVITHGVMNSSPIIEAHPHWFKGGSWGMTDYDWYGGHADLDDWWVNLWTRYVTEFGVDGFRLDVNIYRPDLWHRIKQNCLLAGHPITVIQEGRRFTKCAAELYQSYDALTPNVQGLDENHLLLNNVAGWFAEKRAVPNVYRVLVEYNDGSRCVASTLNPHGKAPDGPDDAAHWFRFVDSSFNSNDDMRHVPPAPQHVPIQVNAMPAFDPLASAEAIPLMKITLSNLKTSGWITRIVVLDSFTGVWQIAPTSADFPIMLGSTQQFTFAIRPQLPDWFYYSHQLSCHDTGWMTFPLDQNPYVAAGSRSVFGYSFMLVPSVPLMMGGEEFNADYIPLPTHSPDLFGGDNPGKGRWLYASMLDWSQLQEPGKQAFFKDARRIIAIRKAESDLIHAYTNAPGDGPHILPVELPAGAPIPVPYLLWNDEKAILVAGNRGAQDVTVQVRLPLEQTSLKDCQRLQVTDLWGGQPPMQASPQDLRSFTLTIKADQQPGGGLAVYKISAQP